MVQATGGIPVTPKEFYMFNGRKAISQNNTVFADGIKGRALMDRLTMFLLAIITAPLVQLILWIDGYFEED